MPAASSAFPFPLSDGPATGEESDFLALLLDASGDLSELSFHQEKIPTGAAMSPNCGDASELGIKEDKRTRDKQKPNDKEEAPVALFVDPRLLSPQPVHLPLHLSNDLRLQPASTTEYSQSPQDDSGLEIDADEAKSEKTDLPHRVLVQDKPIEFTPAFSDHADSPENPSKVAVPQESISLKGGIQSSPKLSDLNPAISLRLSHSFDSTGTESPVKAVRAADTKKTQITPAASLPLLVPAVQKVPPAKAQLATPPQSVATTVVAPANQRADSNDRNDPRDRRERDTSSHRTTNDNTKSEPAAADPAEVKAKVESSVAADGLAPAATGNSHPISVKREVTASASVRPIEPPPPAETAKAAPLRELTVKVSGDSDQPVDLHIVNERGKLHVEVRTSDPQLAASLKDNVGDLVQKLDRSGFRAESQSHESAPVSTSATQGGDFANDPGHKPGSDQQNTGHGGNGQSGQQHEQQQQQQGQGRGNRPRWLEELVRNFQSSEPKKENAN